MKEHGRVRNGRSHGPHANQTANDSAAETRRLCVLGVKIAPELRREIDAYAEAHGITRSRAASEYLTIARDVLHERDGIPGERVDELVEALEALRTLFQLLGPPAFGILRLVAHWAANAGNLKVTEDELVAEVRAVGADEWEQAVADAERDVQELRRALME